MFYFVGGKTFSKIKNEDEEDKSTAELLLTLGKISPIWTHLETGYFVQMENESHPDKLSSRNDNFF